MKEITVFLAFTLPYFVCHAQLPTHFHVEAPAELYGIYEHVLTDDWGADLSQMALQGALVVARDASAADSLGCGAIVNDSEISGNIAVLYRGGCDFSAKALNAEQAGAMALVVVNNSAIELPSLGAGAVADQVSIPVMMISMENGALLRSAIDQGTCNVMLGTGAFLYPYNVALFRQTMDRPRSFAIPRLFTNAIGYDMELQPRVFNIGTMTATAEMTTSLSRNGQWLDDGYEDLTNEMNPGGFDFPLVSFQLPYWDNGLYEVEHELTVYDFNFVEQEDAFPFNDQESVSFWVNDDLYAMCPLDTATGDLIIDQFYRSSADPDFTSCITMKSSNAATYEAMGLSFAASSTAEPGGLVGKEVEVQLYRWDDSFSGQATFNQLVLQGSATYTYAQDLDGQTVGIDFVTPVLLENDQNYLACVSTDDPEVFVGHSTALDYDIAWNNNISEDIYMPSRSGSTWYAMGFGTGIVPGIILNLQERECNFGQPQIVADGPLDFCSGDNVTLTVVQDDFLFVQWSNGGTNYSVEVGSPGTYTVTVADGECQLTSEPVEVTVYQLPNNPSVTISGTACTGQGTTLSTTQEGDILWSPNGEDTQTIDVQQAGDYSVTYTDENGCSSTSGALIYESPEVPVVTAIGPTAFCPGGSVVLESSTGENSVWYQADDNTAGTSPISDPATSVTVDESGKYFCVNPSTENSCVSRSDTVVVTVAQPPVPDICLVSVDSTSQYNIIIWEHPETTAIDSFIVYREVTQNNFARIAALHFDELGRYDDYDANPNSTSYRYRLSTIDTCGNESALADIHNTIHLQHLGNGNLAWTNYSIGSSNPVDFYRVYRDDLGNGNFQPITSTVPGGNSTFTDVDYISYPTASYVVDVTWDLSCDPSRVITTTRSNRFSLEDNPVGIAGRSAVADVSVFPNPTTGHLTIDLGTASPDAVIELYDMQGRLLATRPASGQQVLQMELDGPAGVYLLRVVSGEGTVNNRVIKQ